MGDFRWEYWLIVVVNIVFWGFFYIWKKYVDGAIKQNFNESLEKIRHDFKKSEEELKLNLSSEIQKSINITNKATDNHIHHKKILFYKKIEALEILWTHIIDSKSEASILNSLSAFNLEELAEQLPKEQNLRRFFSEGIGANIDMKKYNEKTIKVDTVRPYIPENIYELYMAYNTIIIFALIFIGMAKIGSNPFTILKENSHIDSLKKYLPNYNEYIDEYKYNGFAFLIEPVTSIILSEISAVLQESESASKAVDQMFLIQMEVDQREMKRKFEDVIKEDGALANTARGVIE